MRIPKDRTGFWPHTCLKCSGKISKERRFDTTYCSSSCKDAAEKKRYCDRNPDYVKRQRRLVSELKHIGTYGHTKFLDGVELNPKDRYAKARKMGYRSGLEVVVARQLEAAGVKFEYEKLKISYQVKETRSYKPDLRLPNGIIIETKGRFTLDDRKKHLYVKEQHPDLDIRFVFSNSKAKLTKGSKTTYGEWCTKHGFKYAEKLIPEEWILE